MGRNWLQVMCHRCDTLRRLRSFLKCSPGQTSRRGSQIRKRGDTLEGEGSAAHNFFENLQRLSCAAEAKRPFCSAQELPCAWHFTVLQLPHRELHEACHGVPIAAPDQSRRMEHKVLVQNVSDAGRDAFAASGKPPERTGDPVTPRLSE
jgi:hypothetical protein